MNVLWRALLTGGVVLVSLQVAVADSVEVVKLEDQPWYEAEDKAVAREIISPRNSSVESMSIAEIKIPVGVEIVPHHHVIEEVYHVVSGTGLMMVEDELQQLVPGDTVVIAADEWHNIKNNGDEELLLVVTCVPAWAPEHLKFERLSKEKD
ncbi:MAG: cupin domain-containing protein [Pseudomonadota bacterium]